MFENQQQPPVSSPAQPPSMNNGPVPPPPLQSFSAGMPSFSPESTPPMPPLRIPQQPQAPGGKRRGKRLLFIMILVVVLLGGGVAVAALLFPGTAVNTANSTANTNAKTNVNTVANANKNINAVSNLNVANVNVANLNTNSTTNTTTNTTNVNTSTNSSTNATNTTTNVSSNTNSSPPPSYTVDSDGDGLNNYLEDWLGVNKNNADSDGDGFPDGKELTSGFSPLSDGELRAVAFQASCAASPLLRQYGLPSTDISTLCGIGGDLLANIQVMASNASFFEDLDVQQSNACASFAKLDKTTCASVIHFELLRYLITPKAS